LTGISRIEDARRKMAELFGNGEAWMKAAEEVGDWGGGGDDHGNRRPAPLPPILVSPGQEEDDEEEKGGGVGLS
jgi:hypothetical protein